MPEDRFEILLGERLIGWTLFEQGDPPMGVAFGRFHPTVEIPDWSLPTDAGAVPLRARHVSGLTLHPCSHVYLDGLLEDLESLEVAICGLDSDLYEQAFPHHVQAYHGRFSA